MPYVVEGVCRFSINGRWSTNGRPTASIVDMQIDTTGSLLSREEAIVDQAEIILGEWDDEIRPSLVDDLIWESVSWVDLDNDEGSTGSVTSGSGNTWPAGGGITGEPLAVNTAALVTKQIVASRGRRPGRLFLPGGNEAWSSNGTTLAGGTITALNTQMAAFLGDINQSEPDPTDFQSAMVVTHVLTRDSSGAPLTGDFRPVLGLSVGATLASQRRRLRK